MNTTTSVTPSKDQLAAREAHAREAADKNAALTPAVDVVENASGITLYADLPGVPRDKLVLNVEADTLTIEGELALDVPEAMKAAHADVALPRYRRTFTLSKELDADKIEASFEQGVLTLTIPKAEHLQPRKIEIHTH
jgi:Molecular chaperone (small heat shock protein)